VVQKINPIRPTTPQAIDLARKLTREAKFGALAVLDTDSGAPYVSRVATSTDADYSPIILVSELSHHTRCLIKDPRCSILFGEPGKGDPLAHARVTLSCSAVRISKTDTDASRFAATFLESHPKANLYISFADFFFFRLHVLSVSLNGGFGKAFLLSAAEFGG
jgi:putative heme iron utilization protein